MVYTLHINGKDIYQFNQEKDGYVLIEIPLYRGQSITLYKNNKIFNDVEIRWTCNNSDKGVSDNIGSYHLWQEGLYNFSLSENYYEGKLIYVEIELEKLIVYIKQ